MQASGKQEVIVLGNAQIEDSRTSSCIPNMEMQDELHRWKLLDPSRLTSAILIWACEQGRVVLN